MLADRSLVVSIPADAAAHHEDCILWIDGVDETIRAMDVVPSDVGQEAVVRTLLRAMESPSAPQTIPARPQKIVVRDRELQFFLRGVLQDLDITISYAAELPLLDEVYHSLQEFVGRQLPSLPADQAEALRAIAFDLWHDAPWDVLDEEKIIQIDLARTDDADNLSSETFYVSVMGMLGMEFGFLLYRSMESLKAFRLELLAAEQSPEQIEQTFLQQDCFFLTFDQELVQSNGEASPEHDPLGVTLGSLNPLEGMRANLDEAEAATVAAALMALHQFFEQHLESLNGYQFPTLRDRYTIPHLTHSEEGLSVVVATRPDLAAELATIIDEVPDDLLEALEPNIIPILRDDLIPKKSFYSLGAIPIDLLDALRAQVAVHQPPDQALPKKLEWFPVVMIQTSRPKANALIDSLRAAGGVDAILFNPGEDTLKGMCYDLGIFRTGDGDLHLFGEFIEDDPVHVEARKKWDQRCKKTKGICGLVIAKGVTGKAQGNPKLDDILALYEVRSLSANEIGLGALELVKFNDT